jgi:P27 family predicted phage terminase small subunit
MARPRQPIDLLLVKGKKNLTKQEIEERMASEVKAENDKIEPPAYLPEELKKDFKRIAQELINIKIMSNLDCEALARFIVSEYQYQKITIKLLKMKSIGPKYFELLSVQEKLFKMCRAAASDLGLTISSRCKLVIHRPKEEPPVKTKEQKMFGDRL